MSAMTIERVEFKKVFTNIGAASIEVHITTQNGARAVTMRVDEKLALFDIANSIKALEKNVAPMLQGQNIVSQREIDAKLMTAAVQFKETAPFIPSISQAVLEAGAADSGTDICERLGRLCKLQGELPMPMSGAVAAGVNFGRETTYQGKPWWGYIATGFNDTDNAVNALWVVQRKWQDLIKKRFGIKISVHGGNLFYPQSFFTTAEQLCSALTEAIADSGFEGRVSIFVDFAAVERFDAEKGCYNGLLEYCATRDEHLKKLIGLCYDYPILVVIDPLEESDADGYAALGKCCAVVCSKGSAAGYSANIFDEMTVSQAMDLALNAKTNGVNFIPAFSLTPGFKAMDYYTALEVSAALRCGMTDYANRAMELSARYSQKSLKT